MSIPMDAPITHCACGAEQSVVLTIRLGDFFPSYVPGELLEPCRCPRCVTCGHVLDDHGCCGHIECPLYGTEILIPDVSQAHNPASRPEAS